MGELFVLLQRRILAAILAAAAGYFGITQLTDATTVQAVAGASTVAIGIIGNLWSYLVKIDRKHISRRLVSNSVLIIYTLLGVLDMGMSDAQRAEAAEGLGWFVKQLAEIIGANNPEVIALTGTAGVLGLTSKALPRKHLKGGALASPNP